MSYVSNSSYQRSSRILHQQNYERLHAVLQEYDENEESNGHDGSSINHELDSPMLQDSSESRSSTELLSVFSCDLDDLVSCLLDKLIVHQNISKIQCDQIIKSCNIILQRLSVNYRFKSSQKHWIDDNIDLKQEYWFICDRGHTHGPRYHEPRGFAPFTCGNQVFMPSIRKTSYFIKYSLIDQLSLLLPYLSKDFVNIMPNDEHVHDIRDAKIAREVKDTRNVITFTMFTDELPASKSSRLSIFPVYLMINELPSPYREQNALLSSVFVGYKKPPDSLLFFKPLVNELHEIETKGFAWTCYYSGKHEMKKFKLIAIIADAPMRAYLRSVKQFNARWACDWCKIESVSENNVKKFPVHEPHEIEFILRSKEEFLLHAQGANVEPAVSQAIKSISPFLFLNSFDIVNGFSTDIMHAVYLGVVKDIFRRGWFNIEMRNKPFYLGSSRKIALIKERVKRVKVTSEQNRPLRALAEYKDWKASEFASFICYFFFPILDGILATKYLVHLGQLASAIMILQSSPVNHENIENARSKLHEFVANLELLYGHEFLTYNSHIILHIPDSVINLGPASKTSAFNSENEMGRIKRMNRKFIDVPQSLMNLYRIKMRHMISLVKLNESDYLASHERQFLNLSSEPLHGLGRYKIITPSMDLIAFCNVNMVQINGPIFITNRISYRDTFYTTQEYDVNRKRMNSLIRIRDSVNQIIAIYKTNDVIIIEVNQFISDNRWRLDLEATCNHEIMLSSLQNLIILRDTNVMKKFHFLDEKYKKLFMFDSARYKIVIDPCLMIN